MKKVSYFFLIGIWAVTFSCTSGNKKANDNAKNTGDSPSINGVALEGMNTESEKSIKAAADISSASDSELTGKATFTTTSDGKVDFEITLKNGQPGLHAVHLHEKGDCSAPDAKSAGGHWNPTNQEHGRRSAAEDFHKGDIGNIIIGPDGTGTLGMIVKGWAIGGNSDSNILDKAVIVHAGPDDFTSQPSGAAGDRIGCGVIEME